MTAYDIGVLFSITIGLAIGFVGVFILRIRLRRGK